MFEIAEELKKLPDQPGVYIMHDSRDAIIYIGKAVSLRKRVHQYFQASHDEGIKKAQMVKQIARFEYIITDSELEALVLECNLIKEHRPKYNTMLMDDKAYPFRIQPFRAIKCKKHRCKNTYGHTDNNCPCRNVNTAENHRKNSEYFPAWLPRFAEYKIFKSYFLYCRNAVLKNKFANKDNGNYR